MRLMGGGGGGGSAQSSTIDAQRGAAGGGGGSGCVLEVWVSLTAASSIAYSVAGLQDPGEDGEASTATFSGGSALALSAGGGHAGLACTAIISNHTVSQIICGGLGGTSSATAGVALNCGECGQPGLVLASNYTGSGLDVVMSGSGGGSGGGLAVSNNYGNSASYVGGGGSGGSTVGLLNDVKEGGYGGPGCLLVIEYRG